MTIVLQKNVSTWFIYNNVMQRQTYVFARNKREKKIEKNWKKNKMRKWFLIEHFLTHPRPITAFIADKITEISLSPCVKKSRLIIAQIICNYCAQDSRWVIGTRRTFLTRIKVAVSKRMWRYQLLIHWSCIGQYQRCRNDYSIRTSCVLTGSLINAMSTLRK